MKLIKSLLEPKLLFTGALLFTCFITYGSLTSTGSLPQLDYAVSDKLIHALSYFLLFMLWFFFWVFKTKENKIVLKTILLGGVVFCYGMVIEVLQGTLTVAREADFYDVIANGTGVFCAVLLVILIKKKILKLKSSI